MSDSREIGQRVTTAIVRVVTANYRKVSNCRRANRVYVRPASGAMCCYTWLLSLRVYILHSGCPSKLPTQLVPLVLRLCRSTNRLRCWGDRLNHPAVQRHSMMTAA